MSSCLFLKFEFDIAYSHICDPNKNNSFIKFKKYEIENIDFDELESLMQKSLDKNLYYLPLCSYERYLYNNNDFILYLGCELLSNELGNIDKFFNRIENIAYEVCENIGIFFYDNCRHHENFKLNVRTTSLEDLDFHLQSHIKDNKKTWSLNFEGFGKYNNKLMDYKEIIKE